MRLFRGIGLDLVPAILAPNDEPGTAPPSVIGLPVKGFHGEIRRYRARAGIAGLWQTL